MKILNLSPGIDRVECANLYPHQADGVSFLTSKKEQF